VPTKSWLVVEENKSELEAFSIAVFKSAFLGALLNPCKD
jgi:hypothetical protein